MNCKLIVMLSVFTAVYLINMIAFATPITPILSYEGNIKQLSIDEINELLIAEGYPKITEGSSFIEGDESIGEDDLKEHTFEDWESIYLFVKAGPTTHIYYTAGLTSVHVETDKGISYYASVPDASIMYLLGPALVALGIVGRRKSRE